MRTREAQQLDEDLGDDDEELDGKAASDLYFGHRKKILNLYSLVECLTQRRRETESAEKSQKSERKERYDKKRPENFFHPIGENNYDAN